MITKVTISLLGREASTDGNIWKCKDPYLLDLLNMYVKKDMLEGYIPSKSYALAQLAEMNIGADIIKVDDDGVEGEPSTIY